MYLYTMPEDEALRLAGFDRYACSIMVFFAGVLFMGATADIENSFAVDIDERGAYRAYSSPGAKRRYQYAVLVTFLLGVNFLYSEINGLISIRQDWDASLPGQAEQITPEGLYAAWRRALDTAQIELFYCGALPPDRVEALFADTPLARPRTGAQGLPPVQIIARPAGAPREVVEEEPVTQGKLSLGFRTGGASLVSGDPAACWLLTTLYGGSTSSKLFLNVRERKSLCYYASAQFIAPKGIMMVNSGIENRDYETARDEILRQLDACRAGDITDAEIASARKTLATNWRAMLDDPLALERYWLGQAAAGTLVSPEERIEQAAAVDRARILAAAQGIALDTIYFMKGAAQ